MEVGLFSLHARFTEINLYLQIQLELYCKRNIELQFKQTSEAVSYTHLDVYKRQGCM